VTTIEESKDLEEMKIEELVRSLQTYELSLPPVKKLKTIALKASKKVEASSEDDSEEEEKVVTMLAKNFRRLMRGDRFKKKFFETMKKVPKEVNLRKKKRRIPEGPDVLNAKVLGISEPIVGILRRASGKLTM
jgi:hypothetical protein